MIAIFLPIRRAIRHLFPGYFALVMATGIVSIAALLFQMPAVAWALFAINAAAYPILCVFTAARLVLHGRRVMHDLASNRRGPGFLTTVAATSIIGTQAVLLLHSPATGLVFWLLALVLWFTITYALFTAVITNAHKPPAGHALHGGWLVPVVATQSLAVLAAVLAPAIPKWEALLLLSGLAMFLLGCMLYIVTITLIFDRLLFWPVTPGELQPPYWINVGAVAITTLAGSTLATAASSWVFLQNTLPFLLGITLLFWVTGTWWIPLLICLGVWRHGRKRYPLRYEPLYWDIVFPLGMYTTATVHLARAANLPLEAIPQCLIYVSLLAWLVVFVGLLRRIGRILARRRPPERKVSYRSTVGSS